MRLLLDTSTFIWAARAPERLSAPAKKAISSAAGQCELSTISITEIAIKHAIGKLTFTADNTRKGIAELQVHVLPLTEGHAFEMFNLPLHHADPFDRQLIAQALAEDMPIVTCDEAFERYQGLRLIW